MYFSARVQGAADGITAGALVEIKLGKTQRRLALVQREEKRDTWQVVDSRGVELLVTRKKITLVLRPTVPPVDSFEQIAHFETRALKLVTTHSDRLVQVWNALSQPSLSNDAQGAKGDRTCTFSVRDVANSLFIDTERRANQDMSLSEHHVYAAHLLLLKDAIYFKAVGSRSGTSGMFEARGTVQVHELEAIAREKERREQEGSQLLLNLLQFRRSVGGSGYKPSVHGAGFAPLIEKLKSVGKLAETKLCNSVSWFEIEKLSGNSSDVAQAERIVELLQAAQLPLTPGGAFDLLVDLNVFDPHENLAIINSQFENARTFTSATLQKANQLGERKALREMDDILLSKRVDLTHLKVYAIDSADAEDLDDGISVEPSLEGVSNNVSPRIWVHVADPLRWLDPTCGSSDRSRHAGDDPMFEEAIRRTTTLYLPTEVIHMFPQDLVNNVFSLGAQMYEGTNCDDTIPRPALSFGFRVDAKGALFDTQLVPSFISLDLHRLTYHEAELLLGQAGEKIEGQRDNFAAQDLKVLRDAADRLLKRRLASGALDVQSSSCVVKVYRNQKKQRKEHRGIRNRQRYEDEFVEYDIRIERIPDHLDSWRTVQELMIAVGSIAGQWCCGNGLVVPFRSQPAVDTSLQLPSSVIESIPPGVARNQLLLRGVAPSITKLDASRHHGLGVPAYVQVTSPIRRALDLVAHFQIRAHFAGYEPADFMSRTKMKVVVAECSEKFRLARSLETRARRYWTLVKLKEMGPTTPHGGVLLRFLSGSPGSRPGAPSDASDSSVSAGLGVVFLSAFCTQVVSRVPAGSRLGDEVDVLITEVDARANFVKSIATLRHSASI
ncbi:putative ribonuclease [Porphyridium purpureum]|uniref:Putative ribonuclease n=1 Tax=Porphyridium purpureum TaxID=35688 RepID=A0A5J4YYC8_PORPP|nr:putative ribonuclease [Porphyridium purpureum]|eukprot:POR2686..scf209_3